MFSGEQEKESIIRVRMGQKILSLAINVCHFYLFFLYIYLSQNYTHNGFL